ncbi:hypothetical protein N7488_012146 [Penicillium malachiteum]|nr:hypothetical protein N7488_012146 [Penicillium malachiteum]
MDLLDRLELLPTEIICFIIDALDFVGLESLLELSPRVLAIFNRDPISITETIISCCPVTRKLNAIFREVALIHTPSIHFNSIDDYDLHRHCDTVEAFRLRLKGVSPSDIRLVMRDMICVAAHIQSLACTCLNIMRQNLHHVATINPLFPETAVSAASREPSWLEELRVYRALWSLKSVSNIAKAAKGIWVPTWNSTDLRWGGWNWHPGEQNFIQEWFSRRMAFFLLQEVWAVSDILALISASDTNNASLNLPTSSCKDEIYGKLKYKTMWSPTPCPLDTPTEKNSRQETGLDSCYKEPVQWIDWRAVRGPLMRRKKGENRPVFTGDYGPFNMIGLFIWDSARMIDLGLSIDRFHVRVPDNLMDENFSMRDHMEQHRKQRMLELRTLGERWASLLPRDESPVIMQDEVYFELY